MNRPAPCPHHVVDLFHRRWTLPLLVELLRGKGNKIMNIPAGKAKAREEFVAAIALVYEGGSLTIRSGKRHFTLRPADLDQYQGERGRRGRKLPRGFQRVESMEVA